MLKIFRKIRQNLIEQSKVRNYIFYAIGEILLVVIGILIALQINTWNEDRKQKAIINTYLKSMLVDLKMDTTALSRVTQNLHQQIYNNSRIFYSKDYQEHSVDSIVLIITSYFNTSRMVDQTYQKIKNSGLANDLGSVNLNNAINKYYHEALALYNTYIDYDEEHSTADADFWFLADEYEISPPYAHDNIVTLPYF